MPRSRSRRKAAAETDIPPYGTADAPKTRSLRPLLTLAIAALTITQLVLVLWGLRGSATTKRQKAGYLLLQLAAVGGVVLFKVVVH